MNGKKDDIVEVKKETTYEAPEIDTASVMPKANGKAIATLIVGIASLVFLLLSPLFSLIPGTVGIVLGVAARKETALAPETGRKIAVAGFVCSIITLAVFVVMLIYTIIFGRHLFS